MATPENSLSSAAFCGMHRGIAAAERVEVRAEGTWKIRNFDVLNFFYQPPDVRKFWENHRRFEFFLAMVPGACVPAYYVMAFLDTEYAQGPVELILFCWVVGTVAPFTLLLNVDSMFYGSKNITIWFDFAFAVAGIVLLALYGQGYYIFGTFALISCWFQQIGYVSLIGHERLNIGPGRTRDLFVKCHKIQVFLILTVIIMSRGLIFVQKWTVSDETVTEVSGRIITIRDIWVTFIDILYIRAAYISIDFLAQFDPSTVNGYYANAKVVHNWENDDTTLNNIM